MVKFIFTLDETLKEYDNADPTVFHVWVELVSDKPKRQTIFKVPQDIFEIKEWFDTNEKKLLNDKHPYFLKNIKKENESIAELTDRLFNDTLTIYDRLNDYDEVLTHWHRFLCEYSVPHALKDAFRGYDLPLYFIGINNRVGEISYIDNDKIYHCYTFNMKKFLTDTKTKIDALLGSIKKL